MRRIWVGLLTIVSSIAVVIPSASHADLTSRWLADTASGTLATGASDSVIVNTTNLVGLVLFVQYAGDSSKVVVSYSIDDGTSYTTLVASEQLLGTAGTTKIVYGKALVLPNATGTGYAHSFIGRRVKVKVTNDDYSTALTNYYIRLVGR